MNLLKDAWIPVRNGADFQQITYKELLCSEQSECQVALPRDDLEMACIQMLAALTQVIFMPADKKELRTRIKTPLTEQEYETEVKKYEEWFDLAHPKWPFMQVKGVNGEWTSIQKLMIGMPEITSKSASAHAFFNEPTEVRSISSGITAIALFNQASNSPSFGGGFKGSLRGAGPISTMVMSTNLRKTVWENVLHEDGVRDLIPWYDETKENDKPVWVDPVPKGDIQPHSIGLIRGLFWQPAHIELVKADKLMSCDLVGGANQECYEGFRKERYVYDLKGVWPHPYSPRQFESDGSIKYLAFKGDDPAWMQMSEFLFNTATNQKPGYLSAAVVAQQSDSSFCLLIGGYKVKKGALIVYRRHELYSMPAGWSDDLRDRIIEIVEIGLAMKEILVNKVLYPVVKGDKKKGIKGVGVPINKKAAALYFYFTESYIHSMLRETSLREFVKAKSDFLNDLSQICFDIFERVTQPYTHKPELIGTVAIGRKKLEELLKKQCKGGVV